MSIIKNAEDETERSLKNIKVGGGCKAFQRATDVFFWDLLGA